MKRKSLPREPLLRYARGIFEHLRDHGRKSLKFGITFGRQRITIGSKTVKQDADTGDDLPDCVLVLSGNAWDVYRALRDMRKAMGEESRIEPSSIVTWLERDEQTKGGHSIHSVNHMLRDLRLAGAAWSHHSRGWLLGTEQLTLPFSGSLPEQPSTPRTVAYTSRIAGNFARGTRGVLNVPKLIWVPGEVGEYGICVTDPLTDQVAVVGGDRVGEMKVPKKTGGLRTVPAVKAELLAVEGNYASVKLPNGAKIKTRVLGEWQLAGCDGPYPEEAESSVA